MDRKERKRDQREYKKEYYLKNKEYFKEHYKQLIKTPEGIKSITIRRWKQKGLIGDIEKVYDIYLNTHQCMKCEVEISGLNKCMDHCHITNLYRAVLCRPCNTNNLLDTHCSKNNKSTTIKNISKNKDGYQFEKMVKGKKHYKWFKTLEETIEYKNQYLNLC